MQKNGLTKILSAIPDAGFTGSSQSVTGMSQTLRVHSGIHSPLALSHLRRAIARFRGDRTQTVMGLKPMTDVDE